MKNTALPRALFVIGVCACITLGCNPFKWPPKLISEHTWHLSIHQPAPPTQPVPPSNSSPAQPPSADPAGR
jgi:hypothetical protein